MPPEFEFEEGKVKTIEVRFSVERDGRLEFVGVELKQVRDGAPILWK